MPNQRSLEPSSTARGLLVAVLLAALAVTTAPAAEDVNRIVLRINEEILTLHDYEQRKADEIANILADRSLGPEERQEKLSRVGQVVMQNVFSEMLLVSYANQHGIRVSDAQVAEALRDLQTRQGIENREQLEQALASSGMTLDSLRANLRRDILWQQVVGREVRPNVEVGEEEVRAFYRNHPEQFRVPEKRKLEEVIVLESSGKDDAELRRIAGELRAALVAGEEPEALLAELEAAGTTTGWIDLGWLTEDDLEQTLAEAAWRLDAGAYSEPISARGGYHVLHVEEIEESALRPLDEVEEAIMRREYNARFVRELRDFINRLEAHSYIREDLPPEAVGYRNLDSTGEDEDELERFRAPILEPSADETPGEAPAEAPAAAGG